ncbi:unnamed protein product [Rotaria sp. Silwood1]|nr:unnamed protein product [Rotaria sp. Silwood1]
MQASKLINDVHLHLQWIDIISKVKINNLSLDQFIQAFQNNKEAFKEFPFNTSVLINLVQRMHPPKNAKESPFITFVRWNHTLNLDPTLFFEQFHSIFSHGVKNQWYETKDIAELFTRIKSQDQLFGQYFYNYSSNVNTDDLWDMFLHLSKIDAIDKVVQKHLIPTIIERTVSVNATAFQRHAKLAKNSLGEIKPDYQSHFINLAFQAVDRQQYEFPLTKPNIDNIVALPKPKNLDIVNTKSKQEFFDQFIKQINEWFNWFDQFIDIFQPIIDWLKAHNVTGSSQLLIDLLRIRDDPKMTLIEMRSIIAGTLKSLQPFKDLARLCQLFNCIIPFQILDQGSLDYRNNTVNFLTELKRFQPNNKLVIEAYKTREHSISIDDRQQVQWSLVSGNYPCNITVEFRSYGADNRYIQLFQKENVAINKYVLHGQFETQRGGQLIIIIDNQANPYPITIWYRIKSGSLSTCHLFHGIFDIYFNKYYGQSSENLGEEDLSRLLDEVFDFINKLLNGDLSLRAMTELRAVFYDKNINIRDEVKKLFISSSNEKNYKSFNMLANLVQGQKNQPIEREIEQVCEWLQVYQYYSHTNVIIQCIEKFDLLPSDNQEEKIVHLKRLSGNENCSLKDITQAYRILQECFRALTHQHLQLIKIVVECSNVIEMMKKADLYSEQGRLRFQELRDNLTTQFQLQELNNMILNSWIITYALIEPFVDKAKSLDDFVERVSQIKNLEGSSLNHIKGTLLLQVVLSIDTAVDR